MDPISQDKLGMVNPKLAAAVQKMDEILDAENIHFVVTDAFRSWPSQDKLYAQGRTAPGPIVTHARAGYSWHNFGCAVDLAPLNGKAIDWNPSHPVWGRLIAVGQSLGLVSGSTFHSIIDNPHFQLTGKLPETPTDEVRRIFREQGMVATWDEAGLLNS